MNPWFADPRCKQAEWDTLQGERAERRGDVTTASGHYRAAARNFAVVALNVSVDFPNSRTDLAIAAVATYARAGADADAARFAQRMLAEPDALTAHGRAELGRMLHEAKARLTPPWLHSVPGDGLSSPTTRSTSAPLAASEQGGLRAA